MKRLKKKHKQKEDYENLIKLVKEDKLSPMLFFKVQSFTVFTSFSLLTKKTKIPELSRKGFKRCELLLLRCSIPLLQRKV